MSFNPEEMEPQDKQVLINSVDVSDYVMSLIIEEPQFGISTSNVIVTKEIEEILDINLGEIIEIFLGKPGETLKREFYGVILKKKTDLSGYSISASDELWKATGQTIIKLYDVEDPLDTFDGDIREIVKDMVDLCELEMTDDTIDQTGITVPQVLCDNVKAIQKLTEMSQILYWDLWFNSETRKVHMTNPNLYPEYPVQLEVGTNVVESPNYDENIYQVINEVEVQGVLAYPSYIETFTGNGSTKEYTLTKKPIATYVKVTVNGVVKIGAVEGSSGTFDYLINLNQSIITFTTAPPDSHSIIIEYTISELTNVTVDSTDSKDMTKGVRKLVLSLPDTATVDDATERAQSILEESKESFANFTIKAYNVPNISCRYKINFIDPLKNKEFTNLSIVKVRKGWPDPVEEIIVGKCQLNFNNLLMSTEERVKRLERDSREGIRLNINKLFDLPYYFILEDVEIHRRNATDDGVYGDTDLGLYGVAKYGTTIETNFILGSEIFGILGVSKMGEFDSEYERIMKRRFKWLGTDDFEKGTSSPEIKISEGIIEFDE